MDRSGTKFVIRAGLIQADAGSHLHRRGFSTWSFGLEPRLPAASPAHFGKPQTMPAPANKSRQSAGVVVLPASCNCPIICVRQHLAVLSAGELDKTAQQSRYVDPREQQHVAGDGGLNEAVRDVARPSGRVLD